MTDTSFVPATPTTKAETMNTCQPRTSTVETKIIFGREVRPEVGSLIELDARDHIGELLREGDDFTCPGYAGCDFRFPINFGPIKDVAVNVKVTGRTRQIRTGSHWVRVQVEFVGDCEPSTFAGGWMRID